MKTENEHKSALKAVAMIPGGGWQTVQGSRGELWTREVIAWVLFTGEDGYFELTPITSKYGRSDYLDVLPPGEMLAPYRDYFNKLCKEYDQKKALAVKTGI